MSRFIIIVLASLFFSCSHEQRNVLLHSYSPTASNWKIIEWNIRDTVNIRWVLKELVDEKGRVSELQFLKDDKLISNPLCYLANRVTFDYQENKIIARYYHHYDELIANECEMPYKSIYHLEGNYIISIESFFKFDTIHFTNEELQEIKQYIPEHTHYYCNDSVNMEVDYYLHSFAKMDGVYPVNKGYKFVYGHYYYDKEPVNASILKGISKNNR